MKIQWIAVTMLLGALSVGLFGAAIEKGSGEERERRASVGSEDEWASRVVWACDQRKMVIVEGVRAGEKIPAERAQLVADVLTSLMRYCNEEITAKIATNQMITVAANGRVYES